MSELDPDPSATDRALVASGFALIAEHGWSRFSVAEAARAAGIGLDVARLRMPDRCAFLMCFGRMADAHALHGAAMEGSPRDRLFDLLMRRIDMLQIHRAGVLALLRGLPGDPPAALLLAAASLRSMGWMLEGAGISARPPLGPLRAKALLAVWLWTLRAWERDASEDLAPTMAALDQALARAERAATWLAPRQGAATPPAAGADTPGGSAESVHADTPSVPEGPEHAQ